MRKEMKHLYSAGIVTYIIEHNHILYLLLQYGAGHWDFPKGKIEKGETKKDAAQRELMEETGLTAEIETGFEETFEYIFRDYDKELAKKTVYYFVGQTESNSVTLSDEHIDYTWLPYEKAVEQLTYDNAKELLKKAHIYIQKHISKEEL
jgi:8-oxo-dGTP pyrophosphatase MutT (NUDIX family)